MISAPPRPSYLTVMAASSPPPRLTESQLLDEAQACEDQLLRSNGYPQHLIYSLRAAGLDFSAIQTLPKPAPATSAGTPLADEYWRELRDRGVPTAALPAQFQDASRISANEADLRSYSPLVSLGPPGLSLPSAGSRVRYQHNQPPSMARGAG